MWAEKNNTDHDTLLKNTIMIDILRNNKSDR